MVNDGLRNNPSMFFCLLSTFINYMIASKIKTYKHLAGLVLGIMLRKKNYAVSSYLIFLYYGRRRVRVFERLWNCSKKNLVIKPFKTSVSGWELSHNAAGRAITLAELYKYIGYDTDIIGCLISSNKKKRRDIWQPLENNTIQVHYFDLYNNDIKSLLPKAIEFVIENPYGIIHLSKPRITNIVLGFLYRFIWGANVFLDIDDEELAFTEEGCASNLDIDNDYLVSMKDSNLPTRVRDPYWTQVSVGLAKYFQHRTVSNPALANKYQGFIVPHIRDEHKFTRDLLMNRKCRKHYNVPEEAIVVLFFGTPKRHKGLISTAQALSAIDDSRIVFLIVGDFIDMSLKAELISITGVNYIFLPNQPYENAAEIVSLGDMCVLMQDKTDAISQYQLPAKLIDALASGLKIFLQPTPATEKVSSYFHIETVNENTLTEKLALYIREYDKYIDEIRRIEQYDYFLQNFSMASLSSSFYDFLKSSEFRMNDIDLSEQSKFICDIARLNLIEFIHYCILKIESNNDI